MGDSPSNMQSQADESEVGESPKRWSKGGGKIIEKHKSEPRGYKPEPRGWMGVSPKYKKYSNR
jgi:hypothetical protein